MFVSLFVSAFVFVFVSVLLTKNANGIIVGQDVSPDGWTCLKLDLVSILVSIPCIPIDLYRASQEATETGNKGASKKNIAICTRQITKFEHNTCTTLTNLYFYIFRNYEHGDIIGT